jgi:hypothetical protein
MTGREMVLLAKAVEACDGNRWRMHFGPHDDSWHVSLHSSSGAYRGSWGGPTLADALRALLADLGVPVSPPDVWREVLIQAWAGPNEGFRDEDGVWHPGATQGHAREVDRFLDLLERGGA